MTDTEARPGFRSGFVGLVGRPNTGKSTFVNHVVGRKVSIVSDKPQTTRNRIRAVLTRDDYQIVFVDTPGLHKPLHRLGEFMVTEARTALKEADAVLFFLDAHGGIGGGDRYISEELKTLTIPVFACVNKVDLIDSERLTVVLDEVERLGPFNWVYAISSLKGDGIDALLADLKGVIPEGPKYYPDEMVTDYPEEFMVGEIIREKILLLTEQEIPHSVVVEVESMKERDDQPILDIQATIYVERDSQKGILIGKQGRMLREIGRLAREELEGILNAHVFLQLWVKYKKEWRRDERLLRRFGYYESQ